MKGTLTKIIDDAILSKPEDKRSYIGASSIGSRCERMIWYKYNQVESALITPKQQRIFAIGKRLEGMLIDCMTDAGLVINRIIEQLKDEEVPEFQGTPDAIMKDDEGNDVIIEIKTARDSSFRIFSNKNLYNWNINYYSQIQSYMGMSGIHQAYIIALNKDTSELHDEYVTFDEIYYEGLKEKAKRIIQMDSPPEKINKSSLYELCRFCSYKVVCHGGG